MPRGAALRAARAEDAMRWAPGELAAAERASRDALTRQRVEQVRAWPIPDAATVVGAWSAAERAAQAAAALARSRHAAGAGSAAEQIDKARQAVSASETAAAMIHLGPERHLLARARTVLDEARAYQRAGDLETAAARARDAASLADQASRRAAALAARFADPETLARWKRWESETIAWSRREGRAAIVVVKDAHRMTVFERGEPVKRYTVELGFNWIADKLQAGDGSTPEGRYHVVARLACSSSTRRSASTTPTPRIGRNSAARSAAALSRPRPGSAGSSRSTAAAAAATTGPTAASR